MQRPTRLCRTFGRKALVSALLCSVLSAQPAAAQSSAELADLAARIAYGFYAEERSVLDAARRALDGMPQRDSSVRYYRALAAFRLAQLDAAAGVDVRGLTDECGAHVPSGEQQTVPAAEGWILAGACASLGRRVALQQRRRDQALARARELEPANPRLALAEAWRLSPRPALASVPIRDEAARWLVQSVIAFGSSSSRPNRPEWGEPEALAHLAEIYLERGNVRDARDLLDRALLIAPDYRFALALRGRLRGSQ